MMRPALLLFHRWVALVTSLFILVVAVTGSALVFEGAIDRALNPQLWRVTPMSRPLSLDTLAARARAAVPQSPVTGLTLPPTGDRAYVAQAGGQQVFLDPYRGTVLGTRAMIDFNRTLPRQLHVLHTSLMGGRIGANAVALVTLAALLLTCTGIVLWWPDMLWRVHWRASWKRIVFDLHHSLGIVSSLVLLIVTASGMALTSNLPARALARLDAVRRAEPPSQPAADGATTTIPFDSLARVARAALPGAAINFFSTPPRATQPFVVAMHYPEDRTPGGRSRVYVDRFRGTLLGAESTRAAGAGTAINNQMRSIHTGDVLGAPTQAVWFLASLVLAGQAVSGCLMWWNGRAGRAALARKARAA